MTVSNCNINYIGKDGINTYSSNYLTVNNSTIKNCNNRGIYAGGYFDGTTYYGKNAIITNNFVSKSGSILGGGFGVNGYYGIYTEGAYSTIESNTIDSSGYIGINFDETGTSVSYNTVSNFCYLLDDGGGIYTFNYATSTPYVYTGLKVQKNTVINGIGNGEGTDNPTELLAAGIYLDDGSEGIEISGNTVANCSNQGIFLHDAHDNTVLNNTVYNCLYQLGLQQNIDGSRIRNNVIKNNAFISKTPSQLCLYYRNYISYPIDSLGVADSNYYARPINDNLTFTVTNSYNLVGWQSFSSQDSHSKKSPKAINSIDSLLFIYNSTASNKIIPLNANYIDIRNISYNGIITLAPYTSAVLINNGPIANPPPSANAGSDQVITLPANAVTLTGSSTDSSRTILSYKWIKISGPANYVMANNTSATTALTNLVRGIYKFQLTVTDNNGASGVDTMVVTVNAPPTANAGQDQTIMLPTNSVTLSGSSNDSDGTVVSYLWTKILGPSAGNIVNHGLVATTVTGLAAGIYQFQLQVTDNNGATASDTMTVTVNPAPNQAPVARAGANQSIILPLNSVILSGSGTDQDGTVVSYLWTELSGPSNYLIANSLSPATNVTGLVQGVYTFQLSVTDNDGATGNDILQITVLPAANMPPTVNAGPDQKITMPLNSVTLNGSGNDSDGTVVSYNWTKISGPSNYNILNSTSAVTNITGLSQGTYQFQLTVTDNDGAIGSDIAQVVVNAAVNIPPTANAGQPQSITLPANNVVLSGSGTDSDGTVVGYNWIKISGPSKYHITSRTSARSNVTGLIAGIYAFQLKVTDNGGAIGTSVVQITVNPKGNIAPTAQVGPNQSITLP
ncbi:MAG: right-handed parallel beta-helix repeat-containing protein, partial [Bacteroidota bacterium]|nr:right-handed parallel beta-helix repeat-containing protein [Bacteroidota bacterium]